MKLINWQEIKKEDLKISSTKVNKENINHYALEELRISQIIYLIKKLQKSNAKGVQGRTFLWLHKETTVKSGLEQRPPDSQLSSFYHSTIGCEQICCTVSCLLKLIRILV